MEKSVGICFCLFRQSHCCFFFFQLLMLRKCGQIKAYLMLRVFFFSHNIANDSFEIHRYLVTSARLFLDIVRGENACFKLDQFSAVT